MPPLATEPSAELFVRRARALDSRLSLAPGDEQRIAEICARLDGLPLAIELAAARMKVLKPAAILERLGRRLDLLSSGPRDAPVRQQTLRAAIGWSYDLLDADAQATFERLGVFAGGFTLRAPRPSAASTRWTRSPRSSSTACWPAATGASRCSRPSASTPSTG